MTHTIPAGMPLTNRLDKMTPDQAIWAIENGDAWIAYLKERAKPVKTYQLLSMESNPYKTTRYQMRTDTRRSVMLSIGFGKG